MADWYVKKSGSTTGTGIDEANAFKELYVAVKAAANGDTIYADGSTRDDPFQHGLVINKHLTIKPLNVGEKVYILNAVDVSEGKTYEVVNDRYLFADDIAGWTMSDGGVNAKWTAGGGLYGAGRILLDGVTAGGQLHMRKQHFLYGRKLRFRIVYKTTATNSKWRFRDQSTPNKYWDADGIPAGSTSGTGAWTDQAVIDNDLPSTGGAWAELVTGWIECGANAPIKDDGTVGLPDTERDEFLYYFCKAGETLEIQSSIMECEANWIDLGNDVYQLPFVAGTGEYTYVANVTARQPQSALCGVKYSTDGTLNVESLEIANDAGSSSITTVHDGYYAGGTEDITFKIAAGKTMADYRIIFASSSVKMNPATTGAIALESIEAFGGDGGFVCNSAVVTNATLYDCTENNSSVLGLSANTANHTITAYNYTSKQVRKTTNSKEWGGGIVSGGSGANQQPTITVIGYHCENCGDDAGQTAGNGQLRVYGFTGKDNVTDFEISNNAATPVATSHTFENCSTIGGVTFSYRDQSEQDITVNMGNCSWFCDTNDHFSMSSSITAGTTYVFRANDTVWTPAVTGAGYTAVSARQTAIDAGVLITASPAYTDSSNGDFSPVAGSAAIDGGSKPSIQNSVGSDGIGFMDAGCSIGGIQSKLGRLYPTNR